MAESDDTLWRQLHEMLIKKYGSKKPGKEKDDEPAEGPSQEEMAASPSAPPAKIVRSRTDKWYDKAE